MKMDEKIEKKAKKEALKKAKKEKHCEICGSRRHYTEDHEERMGREEE
jgi:ribosomal protein S14